VIFYFFNFLAYICLSYLVIDFSPLDRDILMYTLFLYSGFLIIDVTILLFLFYHNKIVFILME